MAQDVAKKVIADTTYIISIEVDKHMLTSCLQSSAASMRDASTNRIQILLVLKVHT